MPSARIATYNISGGITEDKRFYSKRGREQCTRRLESARETLEGVAKLLEEEEVDVAALQEVDTCYSGPHFLDQASHLAERLSCEHARLPLFEYHLAGLANVNTGLATLSSPPLVRQFALPLAQEKVSLGRKLKAKLLGAKGALHTVHELGGETLHIVNAHLTHDIDRQKEFELKMLLAYCHKLDPVILLGDLNTTPLATRTPGMVEKHHFGTDDCMRILARYDRQNPGRMHVDSRLARFQASAPQVNEVCTYPAGSESIKLDYCIALSNKKGFSLSPERILSSPLSNHSALSCLVSW